VEPQTEDDKTVYALGLAMSRNLAAFNLRENELELFIQGLKAGVQQTGPEVNLQEYGPRIQRFQQKRTQEMAKKEREASLAFLEKEAAIEGSVRTDSGLIYRELEPGTGESPEAKDTVRVHYHGTLRDGTVFDSSVERNAPFKTALTRVIPCWTEGVARMSVGGKSRLVCPASIAYKDRGSPPKIRPGAALAFDVELLEIIK